ncbi:hypothetical protein QBC44DRAFT_323937 [Cladorrhinum sp. PSN332]|nr:hypothetical protein QBC44DRAFT_323937 [Cladorrhinum sp. PSN332]
MVKFASFCGFIAALGHVIGVQASLQSSSSSSSSLIPRGSKKKPCPPLKKKGDFVIDYYQLYPENADWDEDSCLLWIGSLWNATVAIYNPYTSTITSVLSFPNISLTLAHIGGVAWDPYNTNLITILSNSPRPWATAGADITDERQIIKYNPRTQKTIWQRNMVDISRDRYGGFQDVETDKRGNTYVVGTYPGVIIRIDKTGKRMDEWYLNSPLVPTTRKGFTGIAVVRGSGFNTQTEKEKEKEKEAMLATDGDGRLYKFDLSAERGKPVNVPIRPEVLYNDTDAIYLPPKYRGKVLLVASLFGGIQVLRSKEGGGVAWKSAEYLGTIPRPTGPLIDGGAITAPVQIGSDSLFMVVGYIDFPFVPGTVAGPRSKFPWFDITDEVERLLKK